MAGATREETLARAREMVPTLRRRAAETEQRRRVTEETVSDFSAAGFYRLLQPARYGGMEMPYGTHTELAVELARGCASSAWDASLTACHAWIVGMFPPEAQDEVWGTDPEVMVSTSFRPVDISVRDADGGLEISGAWKFSSGIDHCGWTVLAFDIVRDDGDRDPVLALVPLSDCRIEDTWYATGLSGTGSNDIVVAGARVPPHRLMRVLELRGAPTPGSRAHGNDLYRLPMHGVFSFNIIGSAIGAARGALEQVIEGLRGLKSVTRANVIAQQSVQLRISEARAEIDAAHALVLRDLAEINELVRGGAVPTVEQRLRYRADNGFSAQLCVRAVDRLYPLLGGQGLDRGNAVNRAWRDVHAIANHIALVWDVQGAPYGAVALGLPSPDPRM